MAEPSMCMCMLGDIELTKLIRIRIMDLRYLLDQNDDVKSEEFKKKFKFCAAYYTEILGCVKDLNNTMGYCMIPHYTLATAVLALMEFNVFIHEALIESACNLPWYDMELSVRKDYLIFVGMVQLPIRLKVQFFMDVNNKLLLAEDETYVSFIPKERKAVILLFTLYQEELIDEQTGKHYT
ncbi:hypothetical protein HHI36_020073 [Cryptolaemus montrouzieri]|uniref:Uncharacterized protein n=1 Tax=Cryptolaemus montrouzieri TaxID=559131 RepID=A0ABD2NAV4_9CUCU